MLGMLSLAIHLLERLCTHETAERLGPGTRDSFRLTSTLQTQPEATLTFKIFNFMCVFCMYTHTHLRVVPTAVRGGSEMPRNWSYWQL